MLTFAGHFGGGACVAYSPDGALLASGGDDGAVRVWDLASRTTIWASEREVHSVETIAFTPDTGHHSGRPFERQGVSFSPRAAGRSSGNLRLTNWAVRAILPEPDGVRIFTAGWDRDVCVWRLKKPKRTQVCKLSKPTGVGCLVAGRTDIGRRFVKHWHGPLDRYRFGKGPSNSAGRRRGVFSLAFTRTVRIWRRATSRAHRSLEPGAAKEPSRSLEGHTRPVYGLAFTPDGRRLVSAGADKTAHVWDVATGRPLHEFLWHQSWVTCLAMAPDGLTVATGSEDKTVAVWDVPE